MYTLDGIAAKMEDKVSLSDFAQPWTEEDEKERIERIKLQNKNNIDKQIHDVASDSIQLK